MKITPPQPIPYSPSPDLPTRCAQAQISIELIERYGDDRTPLRACGYDIQRPDRVKIKHLNQMFNRGILEPLRHCGATFALRAPVYVSQELIRERHFAINYRAHITDNVEIYEFPQLYPSDQSAEESADLRAQISQSAQSCAALYQELIRRGVPKDQARAVLPQSAMMSLYMTGDLTRWLRFLAQRLSPEAQRESRLIAGAVRLHLETAFPLIMMVAQDVLFDRQGDK